jgi:ribosomal protein S18 acetylase RimI-like enzyme
MTKPISSDFLIRSSKVEDASRVAYINAQSWQTTYQGIISNNFLKTVTPEQQLPRAKRLVESTDLFCFVAESKTTHEIVGFAFFGKNREPKVDADCELQAIYILKEFQGLGIGKMLFDFGINKLKEKSKQRMTVSVFEANEPARLFYESLGAKKIEDDCVIVDEVRHTTSTYIWDLSKIKSLNPIQNYKIELALDNDVPAITLLVNAAYKELADLGLNYTATYQKDDTTRERISNGRCFLLKDRTNRIVGTILMTVENYFTNRDTAYLGQFGVLPEHKRSGLGTLLIEHCEALAKNEGFEGIQLDTAIPAKRLVDWYLKREYKVVGQQHFDGKTYDSYVFEKIFAKSIKHSGRIEE